MWHFYCKLCSESLFCFHLVCVHIYVCLATVYFQLQSPNTVKPHWACSALTGDYLETVDVVGFFFFLLPSHPFFFFFFFTSLIAKACVFFSPFVCVYECVCVHKFVSICPLSYIIIGIERTVGPIGIKFGISTWGGWGGSYEMEF